MLDRTTGTTEMSESHLSYIVTRKQSASALSLSTTQTTGFSSQSFSSENSYKMSFDLVF